ncbi:IS66 family insertion sequence element accessory protein TnpB [Vibrio sp. F74]|uniref:IS66 family insertion sequence element accessory protein TnpA n=1 Tax=Vibrio sp. F74 TaxID=700020 RepID=UPI0035F54C84
MVNRRSVQEWLGLLQQYESSALTQKEFCRQNKHSLSIFFAKRFSLQFTDDCRQGGFVRTEVMEKTTHFQVAQPALANMTLNFNDVKLSAPEVYFYRESVDF